MIVLSEKNYVRAACTAPPVMRRQLPSRRLPRAKPPSAIPWLFTRSTPQRGDRLARLVCSAPAMWAEWQPSVTLK
jgi:hypothetical protein